MTIIVPLELERAEVVGCDIDMVSVWFNANVVGSLIVTARVDSVGFVPRKKNLQCTVQF